MIPYQNLIRHFHPPSKMASITKIFYTRTYRDFFLYETIEPDYLNGYDMALFQNYVLHHREPTKMADEPLI